MKIAWNRKKYMFVALILAAFVLSASGGCKEDEKKEDAPAAASEESSSNTSGDNGSSSVSQPAPAPGGNAKGRTPASGKKATPAAIITGAPNDLVAYGGFRGFDDLVKVAGSVISQMGASAMPAEGLGEILLQGVQAELGLKSMTWLDRKRAVSFAIWLGDGHDTSGVILLPVVGKDALESAFPDSVKKNVEGNDYQLSLMGEVAYGNVVSGYLVVASNADQMTKSKSFIEEKLIPYAPSGSVAIHLSAGMLTSKFQSELAAAKKELADELARDQILPGMTEVIVEQVSYLFDLVEAVDWFSITAQMKGVHAVLSLEISEKKGKEALSVLTNHFTGRTPAVYSRLPQNSYFVLGSNFNPKAGESWGHQSMKALYGLLGMSDEEEKAAQGHMDRMVGNGTGDMGIALYTAGSYPMAVSVVSAMNDGLAYRKDILALTDLVWKKTISVFGSEIQKDLPPGFSLDSLSAAVNSVAPLLAPMGVTLAISEDKSTEGVIVDSLTLKADIQKLLPAGGGDSDTEMVKEIVGMVGDTISLSLAYGKNTTAMVLSPNAAAEAKALVNGSGSSKNKGLETAKANAVPGANLIMYASAIDGINAFGAIPEVKAMIQQLGDASPGNGIGLSFGVVGNSSFRMDVDIPVDHLMSVVRAARGVPF